MPDLSPEPAPDAAPGTARVQEFPVLKLSAPATRDYWEVPVVYEDEYLLAVDKPSGLLTSPDRYDRDRPNLMRMLHAHIAQGAPWAKERGLSYLANAHRLDFETSGIILLAKTKPVLTQLVNQFGAEKPVKVYWALAEGSPPEDTFAVDAKIGPHPGRPGIMRIDHEHGKKSRTEFKVLDRYVAYTILECRPQTGRTHQIRIHLRWVQLPLVGDRAYGGRPLKLSEIKRKYRSRRENEPEKPLLARVALHAQALSLLHPVTGAELRIECPLPKDLRVAKKYLDRFAKPVGFDEVPRDDGSAAPGADAEAETSDDPSQ